MAEGIPDRSAYEGNGGWKDGRFGQAYDLIDEAMKDRDGIVNYRCALLTAIEEEDANHE
jgi:hypothetical protein